jgi:hypothetical protein
MSPDLITKIPGAAELISWFGGFPRLHDGAVSDFALRHDGSGHLSIDGFRMNPEVDEKGYFILDKHCTVTYFFEGTIEAEVSFEEDIGSIVDQIGISEHENGFEIVVDAINGFDCMLRVKSLRLSFLPKL